MFYPYSSKYSKLIILSDYLLRVWSTIPSKWCVWFTDLSAWLASGKRPQSPAILCWQNKKKHSTVLDTCRGRLRHVFITFRPHPNTSNKKCHSIMCFHDTKSIIQDHYQISPPPISQFGTFYFFGQETILHSVRCVRQRVPKMSYVMEVEDSANSDAHFFSVYLIHCDSIPRGNESTGSLTWIIHYFLVTPYRYMAE